jgi:hypothetical protein
MSDLAAMPSTSRDGTVTGTSTFFAPYGIIPDPGRPIAGERAHLSFNVARFRHAFH